MLRVLATYRGRRTMSVCDARLAASLFAALAFGAGPAAHAQVAQPQTTQSSAAPGSDAADSLMLSHRPEFRPLMDLPSDQGFVVQLLLMRAHLRVGLALYEGGDTQSGISHCAHPLAELYDDLAMQLDDRGLPPFDAELRAVVDGLTAGGSPETIRAAVAKANAAVDASIGAVSAAERQQPDFVFAVVVALLKAAQQDYLNSLVDGRIGNVIEYQDSWAFFREARGLVAEARPTLASRNAAALADLETAVDGLAAVWPSMQPTNQATGNDDSIERTLDRVGRLRDKFG
jgi:hypothetical protein